MPHSIRDFYLNRNSNYAPSSSSSSSNVPPRGYSSSFNTTYDINPVNLSSYIYTNRFLQRPPAASTNPTPTSTSSSNTGAPRMPQYPPPQHQYYAGANTSGNPTTASGINSTGAGFNGIGYSTAYQGGGNSDRYNASYSSYSGPTSSHTQSKVVCRMDCRHCLAVVCLRGMKAMLLADTKVELYSTDHPPGSVQLIDKDYTTSNCKCKIRDVACKVCGNVIGYHITQPCQQCLKAPNNGHFWMFHTDGVIGQERLSMDLKRLVEELVRAPGASSASSSTSSNFPATTAATSSSLSPASAGVTPDAATTRLTSISRLQRLQRQQQQQQQQSEEGSTGTASVLTPRVLTTSPNPATPTPNMTSAISPRQMPPLSPDSNSTVASESLNSNDDDEMESPLPSSSQAASVLATLTLAQFLLPMKWENLPIPDLDIDLDPSTMGGEPLFAHQWAELVTRSAETAAVNLCLALDQEEETNRYIQEIMQVQDENRRRNRRAEQDGDEDEEEEEEEEEEDVIELVPETDDDEVEEPEQTLLSTTTIEVDGVQLEGPSIQSSRSRTAARARIERRRNEMDLEVLIDRVDDIGLVTPPAPSTPAAAAATIASSEIPSTAPTAPTVVDDKEEDLIMDIDAINPSQRGRTLPQQRQEDAEPGVPASPSSAARTMRHNPPQHTSGMSMPSSQPEQHRNSRRDRDRAHVRSASITSHISIDLEANNNNVLGHDSDIEDEIRNNPPAFALTAAIMAHAAAKAAATDADAASSNLLYGRKSRRDYDMICR
ncbi:Protein fam72a [Gryganskiella cystojenkinii]|nr:Protein fam72a [Gryganskiella cystojenkinii]